MFIRFIIRTWLDRYRPSKTFFITCPSSWTWAEFSDCKISNTSPCYQLMCLVDTILIIQRFSLSLDRIFAPATISYTSVTSVYVSHEYSSHQSKISVHQISFHPLKQRAEFSDFKISNTSSCYQLMCLMDTILINQRFSLNLDRIFAPATISNTSVTLSVYSS